MNANHAGLLSLAVVGVMACEAVVEPLPDPPDFTGVVEELRSGTGAAGQGLVVARSDGSAVVHVSGATRFYRQASNGELEPIDFYSLAPGSPVDVWTTGVELRSLPPQYFGRQVVVR